MVARGWGEGTVAAEDTWKYFPMMKVFCLGFCYSYSIYIYMDMYIFIKTHQIAH